MASTIQIVPKGQHPHVETFIYDNTEVYDIPAVETDDSIKTIHVFRSGKGIDNKVVKMTSQKHFTDVFGKTDYKKYGQPLMMPYASLGSSVTSAFCMRIMPEDSTFANSAVYAYYRTANVTVKVPVVGPDGEIEYDDQGVPKTTEVEKTVFQVMFRRKNFAPSVDDAGRIIDNSGVHTDAELDALIKANIADIEATDGGDAWTCVPLAKLHSVGHGVYGNEFKWRITKNPEYEKDYERKIYTFEVISSENGMEKVATYVGSLVTSVINTESMLIDDVISEYNAGEYPIDISVYEESVEIIYDEYVAFLQAKAADTGIELAVPDLEEFDILFGKELNSSTPYEFYQTVTAVDPGYPVSSDADAITMGDDSGVAMGGGHDGAFGFFVNSDTKEVVNGALELMTKDDVVKAMNRGIDHLKLGESTKEDYAYALAFSGILDKAILSSRRVPADYLLDANYSYYTKVSLAQFAIGRNDAVCYIDTGIDYDTFSVGVCNKLEKMYANGIFANRLISLNGHHWKVSDPFTQRKVIVSKTYWIASALPAHISENGIQVPFAKAFGRITGYAKNTIYPVVDLFENDLMDKLAGLRINYVEAIDENVFQRGIQNTAQDINSDLTEESNMHVLMWLKRHIEADNFDGLYNFANATDRATFKQLETAKYANIVGKMVESFEIRFEMNQWESDRQILHCYVDVKFRTIMKRGLVEIDVNKRDFTV